MSESKLKVHGGREQNAEDSMLRAKHTKLKVYVKREHNVDDDVLRVKAAKSSKNPGFDLPGNERELKTSKTVKVKRENDFAKRESGTIVKGIRLKNEFDIPESRTLKSVKKEVDDERGVIVKEVAGSQTKINLGNESSKVRIVKKEDNSDWKEAEIAPKEGSNTTSSFKNVKEADNLRRESVKGEAGSAKKASGANESWNISTVKKVGVQVEKRKSVKEEAEKKERKVYDLPGQKHDPPEERDPLRIFYESLHQQKPESEMAEVWMMEHGLLPPNIAKKVYDRKQKRQQNQKATGTPMKTTSVPVKISCTPGKSSKGSNVKPEKRSSIVNGNSKSVLKINTKQEVSDDDDFILKPKKKLKMNV